MFFTSCLQTTVTPKDFTINASQAKIRDNELFLHSVCCMAGGFAADNWSNIAAP